MNCIGKMDKIKEELADAVNYCMLMADACGLDLDKIVQKKVNRNNEKYPVDISKDSKEKYDQFRR
ncbi:MazG-like nucleotide pyrophosphohydrolase family protein [Kineothrix alysoides]|uniref:MazG-like nucleotide pyrophosphohydrolase family protein n=1 Tax=Kineothrix alysoides TaxID=1469948 RepID=A0A4R1R6M6_9FIRM|nr:MazG-like nucleotide pyrophosphohydrolase family protein [Kineothrix alysoides]